MFPVKLYKWKKAGEGIYAKIVQINLKKERKTEAECYTIQHPYIEKISVLLIQAILNICAFVLYWSLASQSQV